MTAIVLTRIDQDKNMSRFYKFDVQPTLFGGWSLIREWGRIGRGGQLRTELFDTCGRADLALISHWSRKRRRGYR